MPIVGDTFVVACQWSDNIVYRKDSSHDRNDGKNPKFNTEHSELEPKRRLREIDAFLTQLFVFVIFSKF